MYYVRDDSNWDELEPVLIENVRRDPRWILDLITAHRPYALPVFVNNELFESIVSESIEEQWAAPSLQLVDDLSSILSKTVKNRIKEDINLQRFPRLLAYMVHKVEEVIERLTIETRHEVTHFVETEKKPYSQDHYLFENVAKMRSKYLKDELVKLLKPVPGQLGESIQKDSAVKIVENVFERNQKKSVDQHMAEEMMHVLAAYGKVALKRFCDRVPMVCSDGMLLCFEEKINDELSQVSDRELEKLLTAPSDEQERRQRLKLQLQTLEKGLEVFEDLPFY